MVQVVAETGREAGSRASRRLRREGSVPAILYGKSQEPLQLFVNAHDFEVALNHRVTAGVLVDLQVGGSTVLVKLQDVQRHPVRRVLSHLDFLAVDAGEEMEATVEILAAGVELLLSAIAVKGRPASIPAAVTVSAADLEGGELLAGAVRLPKGVSLVTAADTPVARASEEG